MEDEDFDSIFADFVGVGDSEAEEERNEEAMDRARLYAAKRIRSMAEKANRTGKRAI